MLHIYILFSFCAEKEIYLTGVGFFGLPKESVHSMVQASVYLEVQESSIFEKDWGPRKFLLERRKFEVTLKRMTLARVNFPYPIKVPRGLWIDIGFQIEVFNSMYLMNYTKF